MKVNNIHILLLTIASVSLSVGLIHSAPISIRTAKGAATVKALNDVINTNNPNKNSDFFVYGTTLKRFCTPTQAGITIPPTTKPALQSDATQIAAIKTYYKTPALKNIVKTALSGINAAMKAAGRAPYSSMDQVVDLYASYLLYFTYTDPKTKTAYKIYINDPYPDPRRIWNIIVSWTA